MAIRAKLVDHMGHREGELDRYVIGEADEESLLNIDISPTGYTADWPSTEDLLDFHQSLTNHISEARLDMIHVEAMFDSLDGGEHVTRTPYAEIQNRPDYPDECTFLSVAQDRYAISWSEGGESNTLTISSPFNDLRPLQWYYPGSVAIPTIAGGRSTQPADVVMDEVNYLMEERNDE